MPNELQKPELLAPAGNWDCVRAAVENGADAIYFGLNCGFNARARAANFPIRDLRELMELLHLRNVKGYVTLNTLAFPGELAEVEKLISTAAKANVDALLVQDIGVARLAQAICPDLPLHASTQMTLTSAECIELAEELNIERVVVARELSIDEIRDIRSKTNMPIETFVHGALCVAYSGQCLTSESLGGRSANRGQCAQACRLSYELIADGKDVDLGEQKYLLSPQDLAAYELTPELLEAGVCSLKIEGRLKSPEYVANITRHYRQAIDAAFERRAIELDPQKRHDMEMSFSRGFSPGWLQGCDHKMLVPGVSSAKRGVLAGTVVEVRGTKVHVELCCSLTAGDGVVFAGDRTQDAEQGGRVFGLFVNGEKPDAPVSSGRVALSFGPDSVDLTTLEPGQQFWKTDDPRLNQRLRRSWDVADPVTRVSVDLQIACRTGEQLGIKATADNGAECEFSMDGLLEKARKHAITEDKLQEQFSRLGGTVFELRKLSAEIAGEPMVPFSVLGQARRQLVERLEASELRPTRTVHTNSLAEMRAKLSPKLAAEKSTAERPPVELKVLCRTLEQVRVVSESEITDIYAELQDIREYGEAVATAHANGTRIFIATPRIQKPDEMGVFRSLTKHRADGVLVRNFAGLRFFPQHDVPIVADFSMNVANELTAEFLMQQYALRVTASYDLNRDQLFDLVNAVPADWLEVVIHQHMPMFHMEHCVFCAVLSPGTNKANCGRPCDTMKVELRDRTGMEHPLTADVGCRNTLWNATPQSSAEIVDALRARKLRHFRIELLRETPDQVRTTIGLYRDLLNGTIHGRTVWKQLNANNRVGVTRGTLEDRNPLAII